MKDIYPVIVERDIELYKNHIPPNLASLLVNLPPSSFKRPPTIWFSSLSTNIPVLHPQWQILYTRYPPCAISVKGRLISFWSTDAKLKHVLSVDEAEAVAMSSSGPVAIS